MNARRHAALAALGLALVAAVVLASSCQSARRLKPPYHEPAAASSDRP